MRKVNFAGGSFWALPAIYLLGAILGGIIGVWLGAALDLVGLDWALFAGPAGGAALGIAGAKYIEELWFWGRS